MTHDLILPRVFWEDHFDRCADHNGERKEIEMRVAKVRVLLDDEALANLKNDAEYYTDQNGPDMSLGFRSSARATLKAIERQVPGWQSPWDR